MGREIDRRIGAASAVMRSLYRIVVVKRELSEGAKPSPMGAKIHDVRSLATVIPGVLAQENLPEDRFARGSSYIAASYIKFLESAGARVVPIRINRTEEEYIKIFNSINGVGGVGSKTLTSNSKLWLCFAVSPAAAQSSRLFRNFPKDVLQSLANENITSNFHSWSLSMQNYSRNGKLKRFYKVLSTNSDGEKEFISTMEAYRYPFYAVQWHPEKSPFEWIDKPGMVHTAAAVRVSFYAGSFFVSEAMKSQHRFSNPAEEDRALIYNFSPVYRGSNAIFVQSYYFD
ncbi:PREDICTED: gamma-glutamyl hydrolase-like [Cyprinodon variegatus]|uniref:gamma-glutamyl hydrolase-like n=1 Tax=Cyprinodon variegatus TaxID=28743 RepID=UPI000742C251|nr:PREDICTED: gamma-glutamyl hydrolase-like [Cyprinodon variegatus]